jgi:hemolysin activation/secretion protein
MTNLPVFPIRLPSRFSRSLYCSLLVLSAFGAAPRLGLAEDRIQPAPPPKEAGFTVAAFYFTGNTIFPDAQLRNVVFSSTGPHKTSEDIEKARDAVEKFYHEEGYPTVLVNIPEQTIGGGVVTLQVIESKVGKVTLAGNRHFSSGKILAGLPSIAPGAILYAPGLQKELAALNGLPDLKITPSIVPAREIGVVDVELKVVDSLPLHGSLEINNRSSQNTSELRLSGMLRYDNLWQLDHSLSAQYQVSPEAPHEVQVFSGSYSMPVPWQRDQHLVLYGVHSESATTTKEFNVVGKGDIVGLRYLLPLAGFDGYAHSLTLGLDYKRFDQSTDFADTGTAGTKSPIRYLPYTLGYSASLPDPSGLTQLNATLNGAFRGLFTEQAAFEEKRFKGQANYLYLVLGVERTQKLAAGTGLYLKLDGQIADAPLVDNEQFAAGGMESVRGYRESAAMGDNAIHGTLEFSAPNLAEGCGLGESYLISPYLFADFAVLETKSPLPGQGRGTLIYGVGPGIRGFLLSHLEYQLDWGFALAESGPAAAGDSRLNFKLKYQF